MGISIDNLRHMPLFPTLKSDRVDVSATINAQHKIVCVVGKERNITGTISTAIIRDERIERYDGEYVVNPSFDSQTLQTSSKLMDDDVTVNAIEVQRVSNEAGGRTVYIGGIING